MANRSDTPTGEDEQDWKFKVGDIVKLKPEHQDNSFVDPAECEITDRFVNIDTGSRYYRYEVVNEDRYIDHLKSAKTVEDRQHKISEVAA
jgi:hypothetical protein